jgi:hypothetical protein
MSQILTKYEKLKICILTPANSLPDVGTPSSFSDRLGMLHQSTKVSPPATSRSKVGDHTDPLRISVILGVRLVGTGMLHQPTKFNLPMT